MSPLAASPRIVTAAQATALCAACKPATAAPPAMVGLSCPWLDSGLVDILSDLGARAVRFDLPWRDIESARGTYNWKYPDGVFTALRARGIVPLVVLNKIPAWVTTWADFFPRWQAFVAAVVTRYPAITAIEIFNEPDRTDAGWLFPADDAFLFANEYAATLAMANTTIRRLSPAATVCFGGLSPDYTPAGYRIVEYLNDMKALGAWNAADVIAIHPYDWAGHFAFIEQNFPAMFGFAGKPLWLNEYGTPYITDEAARTAAVTAWWNEAHTINGSFFYTLWPGNPPTETGNSLLNADRTPRPAYAALRALMRG